MRGGLQSATAVRDAVTYFAGAAAPRFAFAEGQLVEQAAGHPVGRVVARQPVVICRVRREGVPFVVGI